ncbi:MAG: hypothetical protein RJA70_562 [Pseudomonadota bacterium]|jgi:hypothetical protein
MKEPVRLIDSLDDGLGLQLLRAASNERPPTSGAQRTLAALGVGSAAAASASQAAAVVGTIGAQGAGVGLTSAGVVAGTSGGAATGAALVSKAALGLTFLKWAAVGAAASAGVLSVAELATPSAADTVAMTAPGAVTASAAVIAVPPQLTAPGLQAQEEEQPRAADVAPASFGAELSQQAAERGGLTTPATARPAPRALVAHGGKEAAFPNEGAPAETASMTALLAEVQLVDGARLSLRTGDAGGALSRLSTHQRQFPRGRLAPEALFLRLQAELALGQTSAAQKTAERVLDLYPNGPHAGRAREVLGR